MHPVPYRVIRKKLLNAGFEEYTQKGSHVKFVKETSAGRRVVIVPCHTGDVPYGTLRSILKQAGISLSDFDTL
jgi:predicted RNA binding protein YcfA (HicA-like mRNA interferase family)